MKPTATDREIDSAPNQFSALAAIESPWHELLTAPLALSRLLESEMDRALAIVPLRAREFAALLALRTCPFRGGTSPEPQTRHKVPARPTLRTDPFRESTSPEPHTRHNAAAQRDLAARLELSAGAASELLGRLRQRGLVRSVRAAPASKRGRPEACAVLTARGEAALATAAGIAMRVYADWARRLAGDLGPDDFRFVRASGLKRWAMESLERLRADRAPGRPRRR